MDLSSSSSYSSSPSPSPSLINESTPPPTKIPLSTSIILDRAQIEPIQKVLDDKITIRFQPIGSTPAITPRVFKISANQTMSTLNKFLGKRLKYNGLLHLYIQNSFLPNPDEVLKDIYDIFKTNNELIVSYCYEVAFG